MPMLRFKHVTDGCEFTVLLAVFTDDLWILLIVQFHLMGTEIKILQPILINCGTVKTEVVSPVCLRHLHILPCALPEFHVSVVPYFVILLSVMLGEKFSVVHFFADPELIYINKNLGMYACQVEHLSFMRSSVKMLVLSSIFLIMVLIQTKLTMTS
jgi:hypothetical protein